ncbi:PQQ-binding-like beta-propeller repeat protein [Spirosoma oryzicola]|uniref:outer membrane protein assembly factor BamB family protein n=1 Tax=Spirosoma oryzicola TaxID=2898794 RepID=UPI001E44E574|nr:PQQ-binding-like beta-propeller repeat protein [Spirosoma oryzicola]UHG90160.1 PQQ-binding-like beta-propeller repeat protein [Spirosoma oryzicola]
MSRLIAALTAFCISLLATTLTGTRFVLEPVPDTDWAEYNGDGARSHYSALSQINTQNVNQLRIAWTYASGGADTLLNRTQMQCNPIVVGGVLYGVSAGTQAFALDAATGQERWKTSLDDNAGTTSRGVTYWTEGKEKRIFFGAGKWLYALDAHTGKPIETFGKQGRIDLGKGLERPGADKYVLSNTPNTIYKNLIIVGVRVAESETALLGDIRAYDARTGQLVWTFHTIPQRGEFGYDTWSPRPARQHVGGANAWAGMAIDRQRGIVYVPTGSAAYDFYGGNRKGNNLFANCLLALDASTGKRLWHYQLVHHDVWDRDPPAPPNLLSIVQNGKRIDAVAQITKQGYVFVFDRVTGKPLYPIHEQVVPGEVVVGEQVSVTQPIPTKPYFTRQSFTEKDFNPFVANRDSLVNVLQRANTGWAYIPIIDKMTVFFPGTDGGAQWGGAATDRQGILYVPAKEIPVYTSLIRREQPARGVALTGASLYRLHCAACHGTDRRGNHDGSYPSLIMVNKRLSDAQINQVLLKGRAMMPSFSHLPDAERKAIIDFLTDKVKQSTVSSTQKTGVPYQHTGYNRWYDANGYPVSTPPWGTLTAIDLNTGERRWQVPLGEYPALTKRGIPITGTDNYGGPLVTAGDLVFIAASRDEQFRAFDRTTGKQLWQVQLPAAGYASPSTYAVNGRQYVVIACGGGKLNTKSGDNYVSFALP